MTWEITEWDVQRAPWPVLSDSIQCVVSSPPYWGLSDYGVPGQIGLEKTPAEYVEKMVEVFREVRRVLRDDGTLWLNIGDCYATGAGRVGKRPGGGAQGDGWAERGAMTSPNRMPIPGLKPKDLVGIPWAVARALQAPYYAGRMKSERDRAWLAAIIDGEGSVSAFHHVREDDGRPRTGVAVNVTNSSQALLDECDRIWPASRSEHVRPGTGHLGKRPVWRWIVHGTENKSLFLREIYPYLIVKRRQAVIAYNMLLLVADAKRLGHTPQRDAVREKRKRMVEMIQALNRGEPVDMPSWIVEPPSVLEPGWWLRSDIVWSKPNPMPESVRDRPTRAHEYLFLLSKSERYYYDADAIRTPIAESSIARLDQATFALQNGGPKDYGDGSNRSQRRALENLRHRYDEGQRLTSNAADPKRTFHDPDSIAAMMQGANARTVWQIATEPYPDAHFATFPTELPRRCILAGSRPGDTVLDPFAGAGTTILVADRLNRHALGLELNPTYVSLARSRITNDAPLLATTDPTEPSAPPSPTNGTLFS